MAERDISYISALRSHAEIQGVLWTVDEGLNAPFSPAEADALERRATQIGGHALPQVIANIRRRAVHA